MKNITNSFFSYEAFSQTVVVKNPAWEIEMQPGKKVEVTDRLREYTKLTEQVATEKNICRFIKDATEKA